MQAPQIADQLRAMAASGTRVPGFRGKVMVDIESLNRLSEQLGNVDMSDDVREASEVIRMKESILNQAYLEAKRIRTGAEDEAGKLTNQAESEYRSKVGESSVLKRAEELSQEMQEQAGYESQQILQDAQRKAYRIVSEAENVALARRDGADSYAREVLSTSKSSLPTFWVRCGAVSTRSTSKSRRASASSSRTALPSTAQPLQPMALPSLNQGHQAKLNAEKARKITGCSGDFLLHPVYSCLGLPV